MCVEVTSVIDNDIGRSNLSYNVFKKRVISLRSTKRLNSSLVVTRLVKDVDSVNVSLWKVRAPHSERSSSQPRITLSTNSYFQQRDSLGTQGIKVTFVVLRVPMVIPFIGVVNG